MAITTTAPAPSSTGGTHPATRSAQQVSADASSVVGSDQLSNAALRTFLHGLPGVDAVGLAGRAAQLGSRSIKTTAKAWGLDTVISMIDLTTLEGAATTGTVRSLVAKARTPQPADRSGRGGDRVPGRPGGDGGAARGHPGRGGRRGGRDRHGERKSGG